MPKKNVKSTDSRKAAIVAALKKKSGATKVTNVEEDLATATFSGDCFVKAFSGKGFQGVGRFHVTSADCGLVATVIKAPFPMKTDDGRTIEGELCSCGHERMGAHEDRLGGVAKGHGACAQCDCQRHTFRQFLFAAPAQTPYRSPDVHRMPAPDTKPAPTKADWKKRGAPENRGCIIGDCEKFAPEGSFCADHMLGNDPVRESIKWAVGKEVFTCAVEAGACPFCFKMYVVTQLPPPVLAEQSDGTTHVCHPLLGGCNQGFAMEKPKKVAQRRPVWSSNAALVDPNTPSQRRKD